MTKYFIIPGLGNSGPEHWQTYFENSANNFKRIEQDEWDAPACDNWLNTIERTLQSEPLQDVVLIGHSLGCVTIAHWALRYKHKIKGAFLVAPSDIEAPAYHFPATGFTPIPLQQLPFKSVMVASTNDPWVSIARAKQFAHAWGSELVNIGDAGHINAVSGHYKWDVGIHLLTTTFDT